MESLLSSGGAWLRTVAVIAGAAAVALIGHAIVFRILGRVAARTGTGLDDSLLRHERAPIRALVTIVALQLALPLATLPEEIHTVVARLLGALLAATCVWLAVRLLDVGQDLLSGRYDVDQRDNLEARRIHTQYAILRKIIIAVAVIIALGAILMSFERVRQLGAGILASAGIIGIIVGVAAQKSLATLIAGIQIAITQPIRLDDVVIVEGEWGRIEEITLTYVVVCIWDQRRLILPITYFLEKPFQNWTRVSADLLGTVYLNVDPTVPVDAIREELQQIVEADERWDRRVCGLQVTNVTERTVELRALVSAADSSQAWDLRCAVREKLLAFIRDRYPEVLPRVRASLEGELGRAATVTRQP